MIEVTRIATIGVYGWTVAMFLDALRRADVRVLLDVRQRRGVRGAEYAWANATRLQQALAETAIGYRHERQLAPTTELRRLQDREDARGGVGRRSRVELAPAFAERYTTEILERVDLAAVVASLPGAGAAALLCVERDPEACHRSLVAARLAAEHGVTVLHLRP
jgi:uncharacterized protein (DUF488 family)